MNGTLNGEYRMLDAANVTSWRSQDASILLQGAGSRPQETSLRSQDASLCPQDEAHRLQETSMLSTHEASILRPLMGGSDFYMNGVAGYDSTASSSPDPIALFQNLQLRDAAGGRNGGL